MLAMQDADGNKMPFVDKGVYSRNRAFRLMLSSKAGRQSWLLTTGMIVFRWIVERLTEIHLEL